MLLAQHVAQHRDDPPHIFGHSGQFDMAAANLFLPFIENGSIIFVGATTENPSFELNSALLSRCRVHVLEAVSAEAIIEAATLRTESRGSHYRSDFPQRDDRNWLTNIFVTRENGRLALRRKWINEAVGWRDAPGDVRIKPWG